MVDLTGEDVGELVHVADCDFGRSPEDLEVHIEPPVLGARKLKIQSHWGNLGPLNESLLGNVGLHLLLEDVDLHNDSEGLDNSSNSRVEHCSGQRFKCC